MKEKSDPDAYIAYTQQEVRYFAGSYDEPSGVLAFNVFHPRLFAGRNGSLRGCTQTIVSYCAMIGHGLAFEPPGRTFDTTLSPVFDSTIFQNDRPRAWTRMMSVRESNKRLNIRSR